MRFFYSLNEHLRGKFGSRIQKISVHCGFTCPNRDGTKGTGGCFFCNDRALYPGYEPGSLKDQILKGMDSAKKRYGAKKFIVYFQSNTNTYSNPGDLYKLYTLPLSFPEVVGIAIGTRPDCLQDDVLDIIEKISKKTYLWMEYGLQSASEKTLGKLNRRHTVKDFTVAVQRTHQRNISVCAHIILGIPWETRADVFNTVNCLNEIKIDGVKIHAFHILRDTVAEKWYNNNMVSLLSLSEYASLAADVIERLGENVIIHRLTGEAPERFLVAPEWVRNKHVVLKKIKDELEMRNSCQARLFHDYCDEIYRRGTV
ncbi:MAG TPA: TIGR01212 family radical SAM protein [bacterium]